MESGPSIRAKSEEFTLTDTEVAEILDKAADLYQTEKYEWCTNEWINVKANENHLKVSVCAGGAIAMAAGVNETNFLYGYGLSVNSTVAVVTDPNYDRFRVALDRLSVHLGEPVPSWNDNRPNPKSKADAIDMFRRAAKDLRDGIERESSLG